VTAPIGWWHFGRLNLIAAVPANVLALPAAGPVMMWGLAAGLPAGVLGGTPARLVHVPTDTILRYEPNWAGPLRGDKSWTALFDNSKVKAVAGDFTCETDLDKILSESIRHFRQRRNAGTPYNSEHEPMLDRIIAEQDALGRQEGFQPA